MQLNGVITCQKISNPRRKKLLSGENILHGQFNITYLFLACYPPEFPPIRSLSRNNLKANVKRLAKPAPWGMLDNRDNTLHEEAATMGPGGRSASLCNARFRGCGEFTV